jgi:ribosomal protein L33
LSNFRKRKDHANISCTADTGFFYVTKKNPRKYDPVVRKHVEFKEAKVK